MKNWVAEGIASDVNDFNAIVFGLNSLVFGQTMSHSGWQCLIFMAQNTRSTQY